MLQSHGTVSRRKIILFLLGVGGFLALANRAPAADPPAGEGPNEKTIRDTAAAFVDAFNRGSAKDIAGLWMAGGTLADEQGKILKGRQAIQDQYAAFFKRFPGAKIEVTVKSVEFPTPVIAVEDGMAQVVSEHGGPPAASRYTAVHTLEDGKWLMASVRETNVEVPSNFTRLQELQVLIGAWTAQEGETSFRADFHWIANKSFIQRDYATRQNGLVISTGTQIIGWDSRAGRIRSWSFDSSGGYGTGYWWNTPEGWRIQSTGFQADGTPTSAIDCLIRLAGEPNVFGWRSIDRRIGRVEIPNTAEIVFDRSPRNDRPE